MKIAVYDKNEEEQPPTQKPPSATPLISGGHHIFQITCLPLETEGVERIALAETGITLVYICLNFILILFVHKSIHKTHRKKMALFKTLKHLNMLNITTENLVQKFELSAVVARNQNTIDQLDQSHFLQFVADNVDHNIDTIDGHNTFHGMGIISCTTPGKIKLPKEIPRVELTTDELISVGHINVFHYNSGQLGNSFTSLRFQKVQELRKINTTWKLDILMKVLWPLKSPMPGWSGLMQMVCIGNNPGLSNVTFLPVIDLNPNDMSCVYSTLKCVSKEASYHNRAPVITFDQPLYWKVLMITCGEECKNVVVRLGGFHTEISFLGSKGRLMSGSDFKASNEVYISRCNLEFWNLVPWTKGQTFSQICTNYVDHVKRKFSSPTVVLDGYDNLSTKDITHMRQCKAIVSNIVTFKKDMPLRGEEPFLANDANKQRFVTLLRETFIESGIDA
ncbi:unnamed protein product [Mytilus coruscus]|uniref:Uncharacterized protein n=1 Tax=Mytilus coruscus TaxID=42192 RepID=A0A6J7ZZJ7_MYTCO|nr:unnamed protein product [Mytilus coruscus]